MPKSKDKVLRIEKDIRALLEQRKTSQEIMDILSIPERTFRRYCAKIYRQDQNTWASITKHQLSTELLRLQQSLEETYRISLAMAKDPEYEDKIEALHCKDDARLSIVHLLSEYPYFISQRKANNGEDSSPLNEIKPYVKRVHS